MGVKPMMLFLLDAVCLFIHSVPCACRHVRNVWLELSIPGTGLTLTSVVN